MVPGSIFSKNTAGVHQFLKLWATPVTTAQDILEVLQIDVLQPAESLTQPAVSPQEQKILNLLSEPLHRDDLIRQSGLSTSEAGQLLMLMELNNLLVSEQNVYRLPI